MAINEIVVLTGNETVQAYSGAGIPGPWGESVSNAIVELASQSGASFKRYSFEGRKGNTLFLRYKDD